MTPARRVFLDSNVLISALIGEADSAPAILVDWMMNGQLGAMLTSRCNVQEVERNLARKLPHALPVWKQFLNASGITVVSCKKEAIKGINAKDAAIVASAIAAKSSHFVTGDKRLIEEIKKLSGSFSPLPLTPREMLDVILAQ